MTCAAFPGSGQSLVDGYGRHVSYLRVSVTDRCDLRCTYCMSEQMTFLPRRDLLTLEELDRLCSAFVERGVRRIRLTGGEPLVRRDVIRLLESLSRHLDTGTLDELTLTTNGTMLAHRARTSQPAASGALTSRSIPSTRTATAPSPAAATSRWCSTDSTPRRRRAWP